MSRETFKQNTIAMVYDFDGTLTPQSMQEYTILPELGISDPKKEFWDIVRDESKRGGEDMMLTYLRMLKEKIDEQKQKWTPEGFKKLGANIEYFPGVESWFDRIDAYVKEVSEGKVQIKHYIISAGMREILEGCSLKGKFERMYASEYHYNHYQQPDFPKVVINDTTKTQFIFRINKGREEMHESINDHTPKSQRPIPFENILYIGDGLTDVPCMTVTKKNGGHAFAVYKKANRKGVDTCRRLYEAGRVDFFAEANYEEGKKLDKSVRSILEVKIARILFEKQRFSLGRSLERLQERDKKNEESTTAENAESKDLQEDDSKD